MQTKNQTVGPTYKDNLPSVLTICNTAIIIWHLIVYFVAKPRQRRQTANWPGTQWRNCDHGRWGCTKTRILAIGVTSSGALGHPSTSSCLIFLVISEPHKLWNWSLCGCLANPEISLQVTSFVTVYCMNFIIPLCVTLKFFSLSFVPLLDPNPGDASEASYNSTFPCILITAWSSKIGDLETKGKCRVQTAVCNDHCSRMITMTAKSTRRRLW